MEAASSLFRVAVDAEGEALSLAVEAGPEIVKLNAAEAAGLLGRPADGSCDAFLAGLVVGLERGDPWPHALRLALGAAAANADLPGAGALDATTANALAARAEIREL
jgi:fructose-1-phosphate kinase PfkB-like protein